MSGAGLTDPSGAVALTQARWLRFLGRLEDKALQFAGPAKAELMAVRRDDPDPDKSAYCRLLSAARGQLESLLDKAQATWEDQIVDFRDEVRETTALDDPVRAQLAFAFPDWARAHQRFEDTVHRLITELAEVGEDELELEYQRAIASFEAAKAQLSCSTCGADLAIDRLFFLEVHVACGHCGALHNLQPGAEARRVQYIAQDLATLRCREFLAAYEAERERERQLYSQAHELTLAAVHQRGHEKRRTTERIEHLNQLRLQALAGAPTLYVKYLRARYDQLNAILPEFREHHEKRFAQESRSVLGRPDPREETSR